MANITLGNTAAIQSVLQYYDTLFSSTLYNYRGTLIDNIGSTNAILNRIIKGGSYEAADGGSQIAESLMYGLTPAQPYSGYDVLSTNPTEGITTAFYDWAQLAAPVVYSMTDILKNKSRAAVFNLIKAKVMQTDMGFQESFAQHLLWGNYPNTGTGGFLSAYQGPTGAASILPINALISYNTAGSSGTALTIGGLNENTYSWWRNQSVTSAATTYSGFILELIRLYRRCALGTGGAPDLLLMDEQTFENWQHAYFAYFKTAPGASNDYPNENGMKFIAGGNCTVVMDDKMPDVYTQQPGTETGGIVDPSTLTYGTAMFVNTKFLKLRYHPERDFDMLKDDSGKAFQKPFNGDSRVAHMAWMGQLTINNRRKQGVLGKIARTFAS